MTVRYHQAAEVGSSRMVAVTPSYLQLCSRQSPASSVVVVLVALCCNQSIKHNYLSQEGHAIACGLSASACVDAF